MSRSRSLRKQNASTPITTTPSNLWGDQDQMITSTTTPNKKLGIGKTTTTTTTTSQQRRSQSNKGFDFLREKPSSPTTTTTTIHGGGDGGGVKGMGLGGGMSPLAMPLNRNAILQSRDGRRNDNNDTHQVVGGLGLQRRLISRQGSKIIVQSNSNNVVGTLEAEGDNTGVDSMAYGTEDPGFGGNTAQHLYNTPNPTPDQGGARSLTSFAIYEERRRALKQSGGDYSTITGIGLDLVSPNSDPMSCQTNPSHLFSLLRRKKQNSGGGAGTLSSTTPNKDVESIPVQLPSEGIPERSSAQPQGRVTSYTVQQIFVNSSSTSSQGAPQVANSWGMDTSSGMAPYNTPPRTMTTMQQLQTSTTTTTTSPTATNTTTAMNGPNTTTSPHHAPKSAIQTSPTAPVNFEGHRPLSATKQQQQAQHGVLVDKEGRPVTRQKQPQYALDLFPSKKERQSSAPPPKTEDFFPTKHTTTNYTGGTAMSSTARRQQEEGLGATSPPQPQTQSLPIENPAQHSGFDFSCLFMNQDEDFGCEPFPARRVRATEEIPLIETDWVEVDIGGKGGAGGGGGGTTYEDGDDFMFNDGGNSSDDDFPPPPPPEHHQPVVKQRMTTNNVIPTTSTTTVIPNNGINPVPTGVNTNCLSSSEKGPGRRVVGMLLRPKDLSVPRGAWGGSSPPHSSRPNPNANSFSSTPKRNLNF